MPHRFLITHPVASIIGANVTNLVSSAGNVISDAVK